MNNLAIVNTDNMDKIIRRKTDDYYISKDKHTIYCIKSGYITYSEIPFTKKDINKYIYQDLLKNKRKRRKKTCLEK